MTDVQVVRRIDSTSSAVTAPATWLAFIHAFGQRADSPPCGGLGL
jgi:hypothetical protein